MVEIQPLNCYLFYCFAPQTQRRVRELGCWISSGATHLDFMKTVVAIGPPAIGADSFTESFLGDSVPLLKRGKKRVGAGLF